MRTQDSRKGTLWILWSAALLLGLGVLQGCAVKIPDSPMQYLQYRWNDACEILELGVTYSDRSQFGAYVCAVGVGGPIGVADLDVRFLGLGGGQFFGIGDGDGKMGSVRHLLRSWGVFLYGEEYMGWGDYRANDPRTLNNQTQGILGLIGAPLGPEPRGLIQGVREAEKMGHPSYLISCLHYLHLGYGGVVWNIRYLEPFDFIAGIFCLDPFQDDGPQPGRWTGQDRGKTATELKKEYTEGPRSYVIPASANPKGNLPPVTPAPKRSVPASKTMDPAGNLPPLQPAPAPVKPEPTTVAPPAPAEAPNADIAAMPAAPTTVTPAAVKPDAPAAAAPVASAPPVPEPKIVVVDPGETLSDIAKREYGDASKWRIIAKANEDTLKDPHKLRPNMKLKIPVLATQAEEAPQARTYTVQKRDTFYSIARAHYDDARKWKLIYEANRERLKLTSAKSLRPGMTLLIPDAPKEEEAEK